MLHRGELTHTLEMAQPLPEYTRPDKIREGAKFQHRTTLRRVFLAHHRLLVLPIHQVHMIAAIAALTHHVSRRLQGCTSVVYTG